MTPLERIEAAQASYKAWRAQKNLTHWQREYIRAQRSTVALASLLAGLRVLVDLDHLTPGEVAAAVERALGHAEETARDITGTFREDVTQPKPEPEPEEYVPAPFVKASPQEVAEAYASTYPANRALTVAEAEAMFAATDAVATGFGGGFQP